MVTAEHLSKLIKSETIHLLNQLDDSSNAAFIASVGDVEVVYKPVSGETPLWDFPLHTLSQREVCASWVDRQLGWNLIPPTVWTNRGPLGPGSIQQFVANAEVRDVDIFSPEEVPEEWAQILQGTVEEAPVIVAHSTTEDIFRLAALDVILNNADRKAGHILRNQESQLQAIDHGVCFHVQYKLRSVLWGWTNEVLPELLKEEVAASIENMQAHQDEWLLSEEEFDATIKRAHLLINQGFPEPSSQWPAIPWPIF